MSRENPAEAVDGLLAALDIDSVRLQESIGQRKLERYLDDRDDLE